MHTSSCANVPAIAALCVSFVLFARLLLEFRTRVGKLALCELTMLRTKVSKEGGGVWRAERMWEYPWDCLQGG